MNTKLLVALGLKPNDERAYSKILADNFFYNRALAFLVEKFAHEVADILHPLERQGLLERIKAIPATAPAAGEVVWSFFESPTNSSIFSIQGTRRGEVRHFMPPNRRFVPTGGADRDGNPHGNLEPVTAKDVEARIASIEWSGSKPEAWLIDQFRAYCQRFVIGA